MITAVVLHDRWCIDDNSFQCAAEFELFASQLAIAGGLLMLIGMAPPRHAAVDNKSKGGGGKR
jgi:hypothetical protein